MPESLPQKVVQQMVDEEVKRDDEMDDEKEETKDEESFDPIPKPPEYFDDKGNGEENLGLNVGREEGCDEEEEEDELYRDININQGRGIESIFETTSQLGVQTLTIVAPLPMSAPTITLSTIATITTTQQAPLSPTTALSTLIQDLPNFGSMFGFDNRLRTLEANFSEFRQTNQFAGAVSSIPGIVNRYMDQWMNKAVKVAIQIPSDRLCDEAQKDNDEFLKTIDENMQKIIKEQVKEQVKVQISKILPTIEQTVNEKLEAKVLARSSHSSKTFMLNLYNALVEAYESNKIILDTYGETVTLKRRRDDDADKDEEPSARPDRGSKRRREGKEPESKPLTMDHDWNKTLSATHGIIQQWISELVKQTVSRSSFNELIDTPLDFSNFLINRLNVDTLTPELLAGPTYKIMKGSCKSLVELEYHLEEVYKATTYQLDWVNLEGQEYPHNLLKPLPLIRNNPGHCVIPFEHFINNDLEYLRGGASSRKYTTSVMKTMSVDYGHIKWIKDLFYDFAVNRESARDVYSKRRIITNKDKKNRLMWIDELHKFSDGTLTDVRTALDDRLKGIRMRHLPQSIWRKSDKDRAMTMI
nr:hypothetical protein [Tanacetum cinerariifolium]